LRELLASTGVERDDIDSFLRDATGGEQPPIGGQEAPPDDGAISTLIIELDAADADSARNAWPRAAA
jgi:hypothetical protein